MSREYWVIQKGEEPHYEYWDGKRILLEVTKHSTLSSFSSDVMDAIRFGREQDADTLRTHLVPWGEECKCVCLHFVDV